ncbi:MAG TPA: hypothetical protein VJA40_00765, partial [archaeon]|nr:hypothetical protein [archaeon]
MGESARKSRLLVAFFFLNLFFSSYSFAQAAAPSYAPPACPNRSGCETTQLSSADVSNLWKILFDGNEPFSVGQEIEGGSVTGKTAAVDEFTSTDSEGDHAKDENFPNKEISPLNHWLSGNQCNGPFSYALRVVDDVRVAQCKFSTDAQGKECEGVYGLKAAGTVNEAADALGLDVAEQYQTKGNTVLSGTFNSKMICASNEDNCDFTLFSDYEKAFNFTTSVVDVSSIVLPLSAHLLQSKIFGDRSILFYLGLQGETPRRIPILSEFIKRNYPDHINKKNQQLITEKFASFSNPIIKDTYGTGDVILATHNTALNANIIKSLEEETLKLEQLVKKNPDLGEAYQDLINNYRSSISFVKSNVRSAIAGPEKAKFQAGGGYLTKGNITVTPQEWTRAAIKKPGVADEAIAAVHDFKSLERTLGVDDLYNWQANLNVDDIWKKVTPGELTPAQMAELGITDPSVIAQGYVRKKVFGDELSDGLSGRGTILVGDPNFSVQPWGLLDNNPRVEYFKKSTQTKELWRAMSDDQQWMTESLLNYDAGWRKSWQDTFKGFRDGGYIRSLPSEGLFTTTFIPRTEAGQAAKALVEKANQYVGKPFYHVFLQPTGVLIRRSGGAEILGLPTELFGWAAAYRIPKTWHVFEAKPGKNPDEPEHDIYKDAYLDLWFNKKNDNGILLEKWFFNVTAQLGENLPFVGGKVEDLRNKKERIGHTGDGLIWQTTVDWTTPRGFESLGNEQFFSITPDPQEGTASVTARAPKLRTIALEDTKTEDKDKGPVIMAFYHHTDLKGKVGTDDGKVDHKLGTGVDLKAAIDSDNECAKNACARNWFANAPVFENVNISFATLATATNNNLWPLM